MMHNLIDRLSQGLQQPLPGHLAQYRLAHPARRRVADAPPDAAQAGVLVLLFPRDGEWHLVLIKRTSHNRNDRHSGQIGFPGGKYEAGDGSLDRTALRETQEEIGVAAQRVQLLGELSPLYIPVSNFLVAPFVGKVDFVPDFQPEVSEVDRILEVPLRVIQEPTNLRQRDLSIDPQITLRRVPYFAVEEHMVWGATAMMLGELLTVIERTP